MESTGFSLLISCGVVLIFSGVTAWESQMIKNFYYESDGHDVTTRKAIFGAFMLYGSTAIEGGSESSLVVSGRSASGAQ